MVYERRLGWRKLPTEVRVFVCAKKSLKRGVSTPHPLHPTYATLSRYTLPHPVAVVRGPRAHRHHWWSRIHGIRKGNTGNHKLAPPPCCMPDPGVSPRRRRRRRRFFCCSLLHFNGRIFCEMHYPQTHSRGHPILFCLNQHPVPRRPRPHISISLSVNNSFFAPRAPVI